MKKKQRGVLLLTAAVLAAGIAGLSFLLQSEGSAEAVLAQLFFQKAQVYEEMADAGKNGQPEDGAEGAGASQGNPGEPGDSDPEHTDPEAALEKWLLSVGPGRNLLAARWQNETGENGGSSGSSKNRESRAGRGWRRKITIDTGKQKPETETEGGEGLIPEEPATPSEAPRKPPVIWIASDLHYQSMAATDFGKAFQELIEDSDGKVIRYLPEVTDALIYEAEQEKPDALLLTGDITMNGERMNHEELAGKLGQLEAAGVQVLVIPGNHDINNYRGKVYFGEEPEEAESVSFEEFTDIYRNFGWDQALSRDSASFSYVYELDEKNWLLLLDTAIYDPLNIVDGAVREETLAWMEQVLLEAADQGVRVISAGHHNLLQQSSLFTRMVVMQNSQEVRSLFEQYRMPLYISGHLHVQRISRYRTEPGAEDGIQELVSDAVSIPPCQYGVLAWQEDGTLEYETMRCKVSDWALETGQTDPNLLEFEQYERSYVQALIAAQLEKALAGPPDNQIQSMAKLYADIYAAYCAGVQLKKGDYTATAAYHSWERYLPESEQLKEIKSMLKDSMQDNNSFVMPDSSYSDLTP